MLIHNESVDANKKKTASH